MVAREPAGRALRGSLDRRPVAAGDVAMLFRLALLALAVSVDLESGAGAVDLTLSPQAPSIRFELVTDSEQIAPGEKFQLALHAQIPDGWGLFWENPGDVGQPLSVELSAPKDFIVEGPRYPAPRRFALPGERNVFGYRRETMLFFDLRAPDDLPHGAHVAFAAIVDWTAFGPALARGEAQAAAEIATYPLHDQPAKDASAMERFRTLLPRPWAELEHVTSDWKLAWADMGEGAGVDLELRVGGATALEFYPLPTDGLDLLDDAGTAVDGGRSLRLSYLRSPDSGRHTVDVRGVLRVERAAGVELFAVRLPCKAGSAER